MNNKKIILVAAAAMLSVGSVTACGKHKHSFSSSWSTDASEHWHACSGCDEVEGREAHSFASAVTTQPTYEAEGVRTYQCITCEYTKTEPIAKLEHHYDASVWEHDETYHWHPCTDEGYETLHIMEAEHEMEQTAKVDPTESSDGYLDKECTVCGYSTHTVLPKVKFSFVLNVPSQYDGTPTVSLVDQYGNYARCAGQDFRDIPCAHESSPGSEEIVNRYHVNYTVVPCLGDFTATWSVTKINLYGIVKNVLGVGLSDSKTYVDAYYTDDLEASKDFAQVPHKLTQYVGVTGDCCTEGSVERYECSVCEKSFTTTSCDEEITLEPSFYLNAYYSSSTNTFNGWVEYGAIKVGARLDVRVFDETVETINVTKIEKYTLGTWVEVSETETHSTARISFSGATFTPADFPENGVELFDYNNVGHADYNVATGVCEQCNAHFGESFNVSYQEDYYSGIRGWNINASLSKYFNKTYIQDFEMHNGEYYYVHNDRTSIERIDVLDLNGDVIENIVERTSDGNFIIDLRNNSTECDPDSLVVYYDDLETSLTAHLCIENVISGFVYSDDAKISVNDKLLKCFDDSDNSLEYLSTTALLPIYKDKDNFALPAADYYYVDESEQTGYRATLFVVEDGDYFAIADSIGDYMGGNYYVDPEDDEYNIYVFNYYEDIAIGGKQYTDEEGRLVYHGSFHIALGIQKVSFAED